MRGQRGGDREVGGKPVERLAVERGEARRGLGEDLARAPCAFAPNTW
jgi:hypothetical protein